LYAAKHSPKLMLRPVAYLFGLSGSDPADEPWRVKRRREAAGGSDWRAQQSGNRIVKSLCKTWEALCAERVVAERTRAKGIKRRVFRGREGELDVPSRILRIMVLTHEFYPGLRRVAFMSYNKAENPAP